MFNYLSERYFKLFVKTLKLLNLEPTIRSNKLFLLIKEGKPNLVKFKHENKQFLINVSNLSERAIKNYLINLRLRNYLIKIMTNTKNKKD